MFSTRFFIGPPINQSCLDKSHAHDALCPLISAHESGSPVCRRRSMTCFMELMRWSRFASCGAINYRAAAAIEKTESENASLSGGINTIHLRAATRGLVSTAASKSAAPTLIALLHLKQFTSQI